MFKPYAAKIVHDAVVGDMGIKDVGWFNKVHLIVGETESWYKTSDGYCVLKHTVTLIPEYLTNE